MRRLIERVNSPTPKWFKGLRNVGIVLGAVSAAIVAAPIALPATVVTIAGYLGIAATAAAAVSQTAVNHETQ